MCKNKYLGLILVVTGILISGCSGNDSTPGAAPYIADDSAISAGNDPQRILWGIWNIRIDPAEQTATVDPIRNTCAHYNVTDMVTPPDCTNCFKILDISFEPVMRTLSVFVKLRNPTEIDVYDVRGILYTNDYGHILLNSDGLTPLWDIPGGEDINPFKAFAAYPPNREFAGKEAYNNTYEIYIPQPPHYTEITFAVDASWPGNCKEPYMIDNYQQDEIQDYPGAEGLVSVTVLDWQDNVDSVTLSAPEITGLPFVEMEPVGDDVWEAVVVNTEGAGYGEYEAMICATSEDSGGNYICDIFKLLVSGELDGWARTWGDGSVDMAWGIAVDNFGDLYVTGWFSSTVDLDVGPGIQEHTSNGGHDAFLTKIGSNGDFQWACTWGGNYSDSGLDITTDDSGYIYVVGSYRGTVDFDPGPGIDEHSNGGGFLSKFDPTGVFIWAKTIGTTCFKLAVDDSGNIYITGFFDGHADFDPGPDTKNRYSNGGFDAYLLKLDPEGNYVWAKNWGDSGSDGGYDVAVDGPGNVYVTGLFQSESVDFDPGAGTDIHQGWGAYLTKFNPAGSHQWVNTWRYSHGNGIVIDGNNYIYVAGEYQFTVDFDPGPGIDEHTAYSYDEDIFLVKCAEDGDFHWARTLGGDHVDYAVAIAVDCLNNVYVTGFYKGIVDFDPGPGVDGHSAETMGNTFLSKVTPGGAFEWTSTIGTGDYTRCYDVIVDGAGNSFVTGYFDWETVDLDPGPGIDEHTSAGSHDAFLVKFLPDGYW